MKRTLLLLTMSASALSCGPATTMLIHPTTGERVVCSAGKAPNGLALYQWHRTECVDQHAAIGFVPVEELTPQQRAGIIPKSRPTVVEIR